MRAAEIPLIGVVQDEVPITEPVPAEPAPALPAKPVRHAAPVLVRRGHALVIRGDVHHGRLDLRHQIGEAGLVHPLWPKEWGGTGWNVVQRYIFEEECGYAGAPPLST
jgi:alkylation response protein AidB-like acyl-CoA dehydrogenase